MDTEPLALGAKMAQWRQRGPCVGLWGGFLEDAGRGGQFRQERQAKAQAAGHPVSLRSAGGLGAAAGARGKEDWRDDPGLSRGELGTLLSGNGEPW